MNRTSFCRSTTKGMTLIELIVVTTILAFAATAIVVVFSPLMVKTQFEGFLNRLQEIDDLTRRTASLHSRNLRIDFNLQLQTVRYSRWNNGEAYWTTLKVPRGMRVEEVVGGVSHSESMITVNILSGGFSGNYAVLFTANGNRRWLLFHGGSGEVKEVDDDQQIQSFFAKF